MSDAELNALFAAAWPGHRASEFQAVLRTSMAYICAYQASELIGYINVPWDGHKHAFILDTTVHPTTRRRGVGKQLVLLALDQARARGIEWVHVDFEPHLRGFYSQCGFRPSEAGVINVMGEAQATG